MYGVDDERDTIHSSQLLRVSSNRTVRSVVVGDFDGDLTSDILLIYTYNNSEVRRFEVCYGNRPAANYTCVDITTETNSSDDPTVIE